MDSRNLIQFPTERVKRKVAKSEVNHLKAIAHDPRKVGAVVSILSVMLVAMYMNPNMKAFEMSGGGRMPASFGDATRSSELDMKLEKELLSGSRFPASMGREPSTEDRLRVGDLHGRYRLVYRDEYVSEIALIVDNGASYDPVVLSNRKEFLERYKKVIHPSFDDVEPQVGTESSLRDEVFALKRDGQVVGLAHIKLDKFGRFYSMKVE